MKDRDYDNIVVGNNKPEDFHGKIKYKRSKIPRINKAALLKKIKEDSKDERPVT